MSGSPPKDHLLRAVFPGCELAPAADEGESLGTLHGRFAVWGEWIEVNSVFEGHFMERFAPGAFKKTFAENRSRMRCIFRHGLDPQIGQKVLGPIELLEEDEEGAQYGVPLFDTQYNRELLPGLKANQYGSSFEFGIYKQDYQSRPSGGEHNPNGLPERTVTEAVVPEFGPCTFPHYSGTTAGIRSITDDIMRERLAVPMTATLEQTEEPEVAKGNATASTAGVWVPNGTATATSGTHANITLAPVAPVVTREAPPPDAQLMRYRRTIERAASTPWAIHPDALATILCVLAERAGGYKPSADEVRERIGGRQRAVDSTDTGEGEATVGPVATLQVFGPLVPRGGLFTDVSGMSSVEQLQHQFQAALYNPDVKGILLELDTPGGEVSLIPEFAAEIKAARGDKPIWAVANVWAASAGYWLAAQADKLFVTPSGEVGSIGVWSAHEDISALQEQEGIKTTLVSAGKYKIEGNPFEPLSDAARAEMQASVDETYSQFVTAVAKGRGTSTANVRDNFGQGRMLRPKDALKVGMVDGIATVDEVTARLTAEVARSGKRSLEPEPHKATTPEEQDNHEPEPSEATTQAERDRAEFERWRADAAASHRAVRAFVNGIEGS